MLGLAMPDKGNKRRAVPADGRAHKDENGTKELLDTVAKLSLANALSARVVRSIVLDVMHVAITEPIVSEMTTATKAYSDAHRPATREQRAKMGMPHHHAWNAMLEQIVKEALPQGAELKAIKDYSDFVKQSPDPVALQSTSGEVCEGLQVLRQDDEETRGQLLPQQQQLHPVAAHQALPDHQGLQGAARSRPDGRPRVGGENRFRRVQFRADFFRGTPPGVLAQDG